MLRTGWQGEGDAPRAKHEGAGSSGARTASEEPSGSQRAPSPSGVGSAEGPARTHLASSSSGVPGHFAAKWAVTALDADAVREQGSASQSTVAPRSTRTTPAAFAMAQRGKREPIGRGDQSQEPPRYSRLLPTRCRPLPVGGAPVRYSGPGRRVPGACAPSASSVLGSPRANALGLCAAEVRAAPERSATWLMLGRLRDRVTDGGCGTRSGEAGSPRLN